MKALLIAAAVLLLVGVATKSHFAELKATVADEPQAASNEIPPVEVPANLGQPDDEVGPDFKLVLLALVPEGFETKEIQLEAGEYLFIIGNRTGLKEVDLRIEREGKGRIGAGAAGGRQRNYKQRFKLTPGNYLVTANDNPEWSCRIEVRP